MEDTRQETQYKKMIEQPVKPLILKLAVPTIIAMLVSSLYNMADTYFVSQLGKSASGAVGVVFSLMAIIQAVGFTLGMGSGSMISRSLGVKRNDRADMLGSTAFFASVIIGLIITLSGIIFINPLMRSLGSTETALPYAKAYASYILYGAPVMTASFVLNNILRAEGKAKFAMIGIASGGILNILLDPIFIYVFNLGISGAAIATLISQVVSFVIMLTSFLRGKTVVRLNFKLVSKDLSVLWEIIKTGLPSFCRQGLASISTILLNNQAAVYGDAALSAMSIVSKIFMLLFCIGLGIGQGYQPVIGYNFGAKKWRRVREAYMFTYALGTAVMFVFGALAFILAPNIIPMFINDDEVIAIGVNALRFQAITMPLLSTNVMCNMTFQSIGSKAKAIFLSCCRQGIFFIPLVLILPHFFKLGGIEAVQAASDFCTFLISLPFVFTFLKSVKISEAENGTDKKVKN